MPVDDMPVPIAAPETRVSTTRSTSTLEREYPAQMLTPPAPATGFHPPVSTRAGRPRPVDRHPARQAEPSAHGHSWAHGLRQSTLASQWCELLTAEGVAVAWLTVDHDDNNVVWFLAHLVEAIRAATPALAAELGEVLEEHGDESERYVLTCWSTRSIKAARG